jgi:hypothetical protein
VKFGLSELSRITKTSNLEETPHFFSITVTNKTYMMGTSTEEDRNRWLKAIKALIVSLINSYFGV